MDTRLRLLECPDSKIIFWNNPELMLPFNDKCQICNSNLSCLQSSNADQLNSLPIKQRIAIYENIFQNSQLNQMLFNQNNCDLLKLKIGYDKVLWQNQLDDENEFLLKLSLDEILQKKGFNKIIFYGTAAELGRMFGALFFHPYGTQKKQHFDTEARSTAKFIINNFELANGFQLDLHSMEQYVGQGRKS